MADTEQTNLTLLTVDLLSAYVANNTLQHGDLASLIQSTHAALKQIDAPEAPQPDEPLHKPAVTARKSLGSKTHIISMIDGKPYQTLKRHLAKHGITPAEYRERYGLPKTYPMVAPAYSEARRAIAQKLGLGRKVQGKATNTADPAGETPASAATTPKTAERAVSTAPKRPKSAAKPAVAAATASPAPATKDGAPSRKRGPAPKPAVVAEAADGTVKVKPAAAKKTGKASVAAKSRASRKTATPAE